MKNKVFLSVISKFVIFLCILIALIFVQNIGVNLYATQYINRYAASERKEILSVQIGQLDKELTVLNSFILQVMSGNEDFLRLAYTNPEENPGDYRRVNAYVSLGNCFSEQLLQRSFEEGFLREKTG